MNKAGQYTKMNREGGGSFDDIAKQFILMEQHARDPLTGMLYHGWDTSRQQHWANKRAGNSPSFRGAPWAYYHHKTGVSIAPGCHS